MFSDEINIERMAVYLGKTAINDTDAEREQTFTVEKLITHEKYNSNYNNDIGVKLFCMWVQKIRSCVGVLSGGLIAVLVCKFQHC